MLDVDAGMIPRTRDAQGTGSIKNFVGHLGMAPCGIIETGPYWITRRPLFMVDFTQRVAYSTSVVGRSASHSRSPSVTYCDSGTVLCDRMSSRKAPEEYEKISKHVFPKASFCRFWIFGRSRWFAKDTVKDISVNRDKTSGFGHLPIFFTDRPEKERSPQNPSKSDCLRNTTLLRLSV
jgi:hypothetical protein